MARTLADLRAIVDRVSFRDWLFYVFADGDRPYIQVAFDEQCIDTGRIVEQRGRKWMLSPHMTDSEVVQTAFAAVLMALEHEAREVFQYRERNIYAPHFDVEALVQLVDARKIDVRGDAA
jgi:hypothetical protein